MRRRPKTKAAVFFRLFGPTFLLLAGLEVSFRFADPTGGSPLVPDEILNHVWASNHSFIHSEYSSRGVPPYTHHYNSLGWISDREFSVSKPARTFRIAYVGDSFVEGTCPPEDSVPNTVERLIGTINEKTVEVINTGTSSYAPTLYYLLLKTKLLSFSPDLVVVNVDMTDVFDDSIYRKSLQFDSRGEPTACLPGYPENGRFRRTANGIEELTYLQRAVEFFARYSAFLRTLVGAVSRPAVSQSPPPPGAPPPLFGWCAEERSPEVEQDIHWTLEMIRKLIRLAKEHGIRVAVTGIPHREQLEGTWSLKPLHELSALCREESTPFLDPSAALLANLGEREISDLYIPNDMHFSLQGYRLWAGIQVDFLRAILQEDKAPKSVPARTDIRS